MSLFENQNTHAIQAWDTNAAFWDERMGEGNGFFDVLLWPAVEKLLNPGPGENLLDVACGNGLTSRRLANAKSIVTAFDGSPAMIAVAIARGGPSNIDYRIIDATNYEALIGLGAGAFDGALCNMALMDMADIDPLMNALPVLLKPGGRFVFSVIHPCFNNPAIVQMGELEDRNGAVVTTYSQEPNLSTIPALLVVTCPSRRISPSLLSMQYRLALSPRSIPIVTRSCAPLDFTVGF